MNKVLVDRELLERIDRCYMDGMSIYGECEEIRAILAQPAEAEGVTIVGYAYNLESGVYSQYPGENWSALMTVTQHLAALSAVTAERDRLREDRDSQQRVCITEMEKVNQLRAEVERLRRQLQTAHSFIESTEAFGSAAASGILECAGVVWNIDESKALIAAMAAKEA